MIFSAVLILFALKATTSATHDDNRHENKIKFEDLVIELTDEKWDQIQKGQWLVGFFDKETEESNELEEKWHLIAHKSKEFNINVGSVFAPQNPGLYIRFLLTVFPKVFYIKNGVAHEIPKCTEESLMEFIVSDKWSKLKPVNFLSNPFSVQMSLVSHLFIHAVNLYNYENSIVQKFVSMPSATDAVFGLTFIIVGTILGLLMTCAFGIIQIIFSDSDEPEEIPIVEEKESENEDENEIMDIGNSTEKSSSIKKRK